MGDEIKGNSMPIRAAIPASIRPVARSMFDRRGPQLTEPLYGREPSLRKMMLAYYVSSGISSVRAKQLVKAYIDGWLSEQP